MVKFKIKNRYVGDHEPPLIIAELGINHGGSLDLAISMADAAIGVGVEIIKHQTHIPDEEMSPLAKEKIPGNSNKSIYEIISQCTLSEQNEKKLMEYIVNRGVIFISTPFSIAAAKRLQGFDVPAFKIGSGECNNLPLIEFISKFKKPVIMSTGMNSIDTLKKSIDIFRKNKTPFALLHCTNIYPTPPELVRLGAMNQIKNTFPDCVVGLSDHTTSNVTSIGAIALGAKIIERHFTDNYDRDGPDISCSMDTNELKSLLEASKILHLASGGKKNLLNEEKITMDFAFSSVVSNCLIKKNTKFTIKNISLKRPSGGDFNPEDYNGLIGKVAKKDILSGKQINYNDVK
jgi:N-acetylneuraminate synthase